MQPKTISEQVCSELYQKKMLTLGKLLNLNLSFLVQQCKRFSKSSGVVWRTQFAATPERLKQQSPVKIPIVSF